MAMISVIVPVYKAEPYLRKCVDSILGQTFADFELILVDDGSSDSCPAICDEYAAKDGRVHVIHRENGGPSAARNAGIDWAFANSDSQWLTFIDSDDWVVPLYLETLINAVKDTGTTVSICMYQETEGKTPIIDEHHLAAQIWDAEDVYVKRNVYSTIPCGKLYQKTCFEEIRYPLGKIHEDEFITYRILFQAGKVSMVDEPLYAYYRNDLGITKSSWKPQRLDSIEAMKEQIDYMKRHEYRDGFRRAVRKYAINLANQIMQLGKANVPMQKKYTRMLKNELKWTLLRHQKIIVFQENKWLYELAYPHIMWTYWTGKAQIDKILGKDDIT